MWRNDEEKIDYFLSTTKNVLFQRILPIACLFRRIVYIYIYVGFKIILDCHIMSRCGKKISTGKPFRGYVFTLILFNNFVYNNTTTTLDTLYYCIR